MENQQVYPCINQSPRGQAQSQMAPQGQPVAQQRQPVAPQGQPMAPKIVYMPVYSQNAQQPQVYPVQETVPQNVPAAVAIGSLEACQQRVDSVKKRVKCSSITLMALGLIGIGISAMQCYRARHTALRVIQGKRPFGPPDDEPAWDNWEAMQQREAEAGAQIITRDELAVYDIMKSASFFILLMSLLTILLGRCGMRTVRRQKSQCSYRVSKKSLMIIGMIFIFGLFAKNEAHELHKIVKRYKHKKIHGNDTVSLDQNEFMNETSYRQLRQNEDSDVKQWIEMMKHETRFSDDEETCNAYDEDSCHSDDTCSWCKAAAVPSSCHSVDNAQKLPSAVFQCDNLSQDEESFKNEGPWGYSGGRHGGKHGGKHGAQHDGPPRHGDKPCKGRLMMKRACLGYIFFIFFHMFNHFSLFKSLKALETKRVENGEVLSEDNGCCPWDKKKNWKKKFNQPVNNSESSSTNASQMQ